MDKKHNRSLLFQRRRHRLTEEDLRKAVAPGEVAFLERKVKKRAQNTLKDVVRIRHVIVGILPSVKITNLHRDADSATNDSSDVLRRMGSPVKSQRKWVERIRRLTEGLYTIGLRVPRYRTSAKVNPTEKLKIRTKLHRHILQRHITSRKKIRKNKVPS